MFTRQFRQFCCLLLCLGAVLTAAALPGDLNNDGQLNVADLVRIKAMIGGIVSPTIEADLNFDGRVDNEDLGLLESALRGNPLPVFLAKATLGSAGGTFAPANSGFQLEIPSGAITTTSEIVLASIDRQILQDYSVSTDASSTPLMLFGLPAAANLKFTFDLPPASRDGGESYSLVLGSYHLPRNAEEADWHFQLLDQPEEGISRENGKLVWRPQPIQEQPATRSAGGGTPGFIFNIERNWLGGTFYASNHFRLQPLTSSTTSTEMAQMEALLRDLENAFSIGVGMGFPENKRTDNWGDSASLIKVVIKKPAKAKFYGLIGENEDAESAWCNPPGYWSPPWLELNTGVVTSANRREIVSHEFFHYLQYYYASNTTTVWLDEMSATWMEGRVSSQGDNYCPSTYKNPRAPINGLYRSSSLFSPNNAGFHGYSVSAFAYYLSKHYGWKANFWHTVFSHPDYADGKGMEPLRAAAPLISEGGLGYLYHVFLRNYLSDGVSDAPNGKMPFGSGSQRSLAIFQEIDQNEDDWKRFPQTGKINKIEKVSALSEKLEYEFQVQDLGAATWLFSFPKPREVIKKGMYARVEIADVCDNLFAVLFKGPQTVGITKIDSVEHNTSKKLRRLDFSLASLESSDRLMNVGLVAVNTNEYTGDSPKISPAKMSVQFLGLITLPTSTTYFKLWGELFQQGSSDLEVTCDTAGVLGEYTVAPWHPGESGGHTIGPHSIVTAQIDSPWPQSIRLRSNIKIFDLGEIHGKTNAGTDFTAHAVPTENALIYIDSRHHGETGFYKSEERRVPLASLASENGVVIDINPQLLTDSVNITIRSIYTSNYDLGSGDNLTFVTLILLPSNPVNN